MARQDPPQPPLRAGSAPPEARAERLSRDPVVGVSVCLDAGRKLRAGNDYWYVSRSYTQALSSVGAAPLLLCPDTPVEVCLAACDGLVLSGGGDLPESFAGPRFASGAWTGSVPGEAEAPERIAWERELLDAFSARGKPVLGVCFGMQLMNLHFGGTLHLDLSQRGATLDHGGGGRATAHALRLAAASPFFGSLELPPLVSSSHRQAVASVAPGFEPRAWAEDGVVEAIERDALIGVEWHPESDGSAAAVYGRFRALVAARIAERAPRR